MNQVTVGLAMLIAIELTENQIVTIEAAHENDVTWFVP